MSRVCETVSLDRAGGDDRPGRGDVRGDATRSAHDLGECVANPEWLTEDRCDEKEGETYDHDGDATTDPVQSWKEGDSYRGESPSYALNLRPRQ